MVDTSKGRNFRSCCDIVFSINMTTVQILSVSDATASLKHAIESNTAFTEIWLEGELSRVTKHKSGHIYFTIKDTDASVRCAFFRNTNGPFRDKVEDNTSVLIFGSFNFYSPRGELQFIVEHLESGEIGPLWAEYERRKEKLKLEGLFDPARKRPLPKFPKKIVAITSPTGAVIEDIKTVLRRRWPLASLEIEPVLVQGQNAIKSIVSGLRKANGEISGIADVAILARGGGSIEDLWVFNEEEVVRAVHGSAIPIVSAIGHETDTTLTDMAADLRAPTPSVAAELCVPDQQEIRTIIDSTLGRAGSAMKAEIEERLKWTIQARSSMHKNMPQIDVFAADLEQLHNRIAIASSQRISDLRTLNRSARLQLANLSPQATLERGYSLTSRGGQPIKRLSEVADEDRVSIHWADGTADGIIQKD